MSSAPQRDDRSKRHDRDGAIWDQSCREREPFMQSLAAPVSFAVREGLNLHPEFYQRDVVDGNGAKRKARTSVGD